MAASSGEYEMVRNLPCDEIEEWLRGTYPNGRPAQWWNSILESVESEVIAHIHNREVVDREIFDLASHLLRLGRHDSMDVGNSGYWRLRVAALARRAGISPTSLPDDLTPDGAVRTAISLVSITREQAVTLAQRRNALFLGDESVEVSDEEIRALRDCELIIPALEWIREIVIDRGLKAEVAEWFRAYDMMAPTTA